MASSSGSTPGDVFDVRKIRRFVELMNEHDLSEIDLRQGEQRIRLRRGGELAPAGSLPYLVAGAAPPAAGGITGAPAPGGTQAAATPGAAPASDESHLTLIKSPMVGTFYTSPNPDAPPFVKVGDRVGPETPVCIIEAMKVFNELPAECSGRIVAVLAQNGDAIQYGQPLFKVDPTSI